MDEPGLREIRLDADDLVVDVMVVGCVSAEHLERVERKAVPAVVVDGLACREGEEKGGLSDGELRDGLGEHGTQRVEQEALDGVVVERTKGIWHVEPVVHRVEVLVEELVNVHRAMEEVLPGVEDDPGRKKTREVSDGYGYPGGNTYMARRSCAAGMRYQYRR